MLNSNYRFHYKFHVYQEFFNYLLEEMKWIQCVVHGSFYFLIFKRLYLFIFRQKGRGEKEKEIKHWCVRETFISCLLHTPKWEPGLHPSMCLGKESNPQPSVHRPVLNPARTIYDNLLKNLLGYWSLANDVRQMCTDK